MGLPTPATSVHAQLNHGNVMAASSILIVDDEPGIRELLAMILEAAGHSVAAAKDGVEAPKIMASRDVEIVITDLLMPERDGLEFITEIRSKYRSEEHTSELQSLRHLVCRLLLEK